MIIKSKKHNLALLININNVLLNNYYNKNKLIHYNYALSNYNNISLYNQSQVQLGNKKILTKWVKTSFKLFVNLSSYNRKHLLKVHHSYIHDGLLNSNGNGGFTNLKLFFSLYKKFIYMLYHLFYYNITNLIFSSNIFKEETCSLNWSNLSDKLFIWKYNYYSIFYRQTKLDDRLPSVFNIFKSSGISSSIIVDTLYHNKTIYYLRRSQFYTLGLVEGNNTKYIVDASLPALSESILTQLFFIRTILYLKKVNKLS